MRDLLLKLFTPVFLLVAFIVATVYRLLFGWWLDPIYARKFDRRFAEDIRAKLPFLFDEHGAKLLENDKGLPHVMDAAYATFQAGNLHLRFMTGGGDLTVLVAPSHSPSEWDELSLVVMAIDTPQGLSSRAKVGWLEDVAQLLKARWADLNEALSPEQYPVLRRRLDAIYDLRADDLWHAGITIPRRLRTGPRAPLPVAKRR